MDRFVGSRTKEPLSARSRSSGPRGPTRDRDDRGAAEWVYGRRTVAEQLAAAPQSCVRLIVAQGTRVPAEILDQATRLGIPVEEEARRSLDQMTRGGNHQGVCLEAGGWSYRSLEEIAARAREPGRLPVVIALDCVQDPRNLGAVLRVADGVGAAGVVIPKDRAASLGAAAARVAAGAATTVPVARVVNLSRALDALRDMGFWVVGTADGAANDLYRAEGLFPSVIVFGGEGRGIRSKVAERCDILVSVPMAGVISSLNVGVACGVVCYEFFRRFRSVAGKLFWA